MRAQQTNQLRRPGSITTSGIPKKRPRSEPKKRCRFAKALLDFSLPRVPPGANDEAVGGPNHPSLVAVDTHSGNLARRVGQHQHRLPATRSSQQPVDRPVQAVETPQTIVREPIPQVPHAGTP